MPPGKSPVGKNKNQAQQKQNSPPAARARTRSATAQGQSVAAAGAAGAPATAIKTASGFGTEATEPSAQQEKMRGNDRRPTPGSTYWLSLYVVVAARRSSSTS